MLSGTGKTKVIVAAARVAAARGERVLLSAPSNLAVDNLAMRLREADPTLRMVRVGNPERINAEVLASLSPAAVAASRAPLLVEEAAAELRARTRQVQNY